MAESVKRVLTIERCIPKKQGVGQYGEWTLYEVVGRNADGAPLEDCVAFKDFSGQSGEFEVTSKTNEYGTSYTIKKPGAFGALGPRVEALEQKIAAIEQALNVGAHPTRVSDAPVPTPVKAIDNSSIPF